MPKKFFVPPYRKKIYPHSSRATELNKRAYWLSWAGYFLSLFSIPLCAPLTGYLLGRLASPSSFWGTVIALSPMILVFALNEIIGTLLRRRAEAWAEEDAEALQLEAAARQLEAKQRRKEKQKKEEQQRQKNAAKRRKKRS